MEKVCSYEALFVIRPNLAEEETAAVVNKFTTLIADNGGTVESVNEWGKRRLAYPIEKITEGYYVLVNFKSEAALPAELNRVFGITDEVMRYLVTRSTGAVTAPKAEEAPVAEETVAPATEEPADTAAAE